MPELLPLQVEGVNWINKQLTQYKGVILADRMGLGKTAQAIEVMKAGVKSGRPVLVICPAYIVYNWLDELDLWGWTGSRCVIDIGSQVIHDADLYIVSYTLAVKDGIFNQLFKKEFSLIVCDEGHYLKGWNTNRSRRILGTRRNKKNHLLNRCQKMLLMTGTPLMNRIDELYNIIIRIAPEVLKYVSRDQFIMYFAGKVEFTPWGMKHHGVKNVGELRSLIAPVLLSRTKIEGLAPRVDKEIKIKLTGAQLKKYIKEEEKFLATHGVTEREVEKLQKLTAVDVAQLAAVRQRVALHKIPVFMRGLEDALEKTDQVVVYVYFRETQRILAEEIKRRFPKKTLEIINGSVTLKARHLAVKRVQAGKVNILLATIGALREGVNLTNAHVVKFLELDWTPSNIEQAIARLHRKGQEHQVQVYYYYVDGGVDRHVVRLLKSKAAVIKKVIG